MHSKNYKAMSVEETLKDLNTSLEKGLSEEDAKKRLEKYGLNEIPEKKKSPILKFLSYFWGPIPWMIEIAAILSILVKHWEDFWIIFSLLILNAVVGFWEEKKAEDVIAFLQNKMAVRARVLRDGKWKVIPGKFLVPGDIVRIRMGDIVPADIKLVDGEFLSVDQSALTGESLLVTKKLGDILFSGSIVKKGEMTGVVVATGMNTYFGKTVKLVEEAKTVSTFQKMILRVGNYLIILALILVSTVFFVAIYRNESIIETLRFSLVLTVAAIPAALPAVLSITMAVGAYNLAKKKAIVRKLTAIDELAGVDILCSDKTGTLTQNKLTPGTPIGFNNFKREDVILYGALASREEDNDPIDMAILNSLEKFGLREKIKKFKQKSFIPFDPIRKRTEAEIEGDENFRVSKGAPQVILDLCDISEKEREKVEKIVESYAKHGYRTLGVAIKEKDKWKFVGLIPLFDPPRPDAPRAIKAIKMMGVKIKMITGDHASIAKHIGEMLGIGNKAVSMGELEKLRKKGKDIISIVEESDIFAEVFPEHKYEIVESLQKKGHLVAMTGDGVNDAPALKKADCGIAVSGATDAARAAAAVALLEPGLTVIADAIKEARKIFARMESYVVYRITETIRVLFFIALSIMIFNFYPINALMIVLIALLNDVPILAIAYDNVNIHNKPVMWNMHKVLLLSSILGIAGVISSFLLFYIAKDILNLSATQIQTFIFLKLAVAGHLTIFITRSEKFLWSKPWPSGLLFWSAVITKIAATLIAAYGFLMSPINWWLIALIWSYAIIWMFALDQIKAGTLKRIKSLY